MLNTQTPGMHGLCCAIRPRPLKKFCKNSENLIITYIYIYTISICITSYTREREQCSDFLKSFSCVTLRLQCNSCSLDGGHAPPSNVSCNWRRGLQVAEEIIIIKSLLYMRIQISHYMRNKSLYYTVHLYKNSLQ